MTELDDAVQRVWPGRGARFEVLGGGITNHNAKVEVDGDVFVLRVAGRDTDLLGIDRSVELAATRAAAELGIGPEVVDFVEPEGWLVTRFITGATPPLEQMRDPRMLERVAAVLRAFHDGPAIPGELRLLPGRRGLPGDCARARWRYRGRVRNGRTRSPASIESRRGGAAPVPCHNDLLNANFLDDGERLRIVDWEYAGMGDRFFDLANFSINHELDVDGCALLLRAYFGETRPEDTAALELMRFMSDFREAMWGVVQAAVSELDFDFVAYAREHFERLERTASSQSFVSALEA